jgi:carbonic anhydrase
MKTNQVKTIFSACLVVLFATCKKEDDEPLHQGDPDWNYENPDWASIGFGDCKGKVQSPINIDTSKTVKAALEAIHFEYEKFRYSIVDNGHTVEVVNEGANSITIDGATYQFKQFHFHHSSEHEINNVQAPLEIHFVHVEEGTANIAVIAVLVEEGAENAILKNIWNNIPTTKKKEVHTADSIDIGDLMPDGKNYYTYVGSLTTPPCSMGLKWMVMKETIQAGYAQINTFKSIYNNNARPLQNLNGRLVLEKVN